MPDIANRVADAWAEHAEHYIAMHWRPYLLSFMFEPLPGDEGRRMEQMVRYLELAYGIFVTRIVRNPHRQNRQTYLPIWLCSPDLPVVKQRKKDKASLRDVIVNDGLHYHAILLLPPWSRIKDIEQHFEQLRPTYRQHACLDWVDVEPITENISRVVGYALKQNIKGRFDVGENLVLPRPLSEIADRRVSLAFPG